MDIMIEKLACRLGRNDEIPNIELAELLCHNEDVMGINEIVRGLESKDKAIANDCIKVLYEIGKKKPHLISEYANVFLTLLFSRNNRLVWGSMTALAAITESVPDIIYGEIDRVLSVFHGGGVITVDNSITVLSKLCRANKVYENHIFPLLLEHLQNCRPKEVAQHAERISVCVNKDNAKEFFDVLNTRKDHLTNAQNERIRKLEVKISNYL